MCSYLSRPWAVYVKFGHWVCRESWLNSHKNSSTNCPSSQGWASGVLLQSIYVVCLVCIIWFVEVRLGGSFFSFLASVPYTCFSM